MSEGTKRKDLDTTTHQSLKQGEETNNNSQVLTTFTLHFE